MIQFKIGAGGVCSILLLLAKLAGMFPYSWWWILVPYLISLVFSIILIATAVGLALDGD